MLCFRTVEEITSLSKCPSCGRDNVATARACEWPSCRAPLKTDRECLWSIDEAITAASSSLLKVRNDAAEINASLKTIKRIAIWFLVLSILGLILGFIAAAGGFR